MKKSALLCLLIQGIATVLLGGLNAAYPNRRQPTCCVCVWDGYRQKKLPAQVLGMYKVSPQEMQVTLYGHNQLMCLSKLYNDSLAQDCSISSALAMEILQSCIKSLMYRVISINPLGIVDCVFHLAENLTMTISNAHYFWWSILEPLIYTRG